MAPTDQGQQRLEVAGLDEDIPSHATVVEALEAEAAEEALKANEWLHRYLAGTDQES